ncbi:MAG: glycosyltransferase [Fastidiosipilaceae bacterium]|jgi:glycosyltransferase involved in cell wall biosynthesis
MRTVLIIAPSFNQTQNIGSVRLRGLAKYLPDHGWQPTILTAGHPSQLTGNVRVIGVPYIDALIHWKRKLNLTEDKPACEQLEFLKKHKESRLLDKIYDVFEEIFFYPDASIRWYATAIKEGRNLINEEHFDAIISSSAPYTSHLVAHQLKKESGIPWLADLRDLWTQNHAYKYSRLRKLREKRLEVNTLKLADAITTVSDPWSAKLNKLHKSKRITTITNGYDPDLMSNGNHLSEEFTITYTGTIYREYQDPEPLFKALHDLIAEDIIDPGEVSVNFYGRNLSFLSKKIEKYNLENIVHLKGLVSREEVVRKQRASQILLLLSWNDPNEKGVIPAKIFEYFTAKRPVLSIGEYGGGEVKKILMETSAGIDLTKISEIKQEIAKSYMEFKDRGAVQYRGNRSEVEKYSQIQMARKFADILDEIT